MYFMFYDQYCLLCKQAGISPSKAAQEMGIAKSTVSVWKNRGTTPQAEQLQKIAEYFNVTTDYLLTGDDKIKNTVGNVSNSAVVQGPSGDVSISNIVGLQDNEAELLRVFRGLDIRGQTAVLMAAYEEEEKMDNKK